MRKLDPSEWNHGLSCYQYHKCRCEICTQANYEDHERRAQPGHSFVHGRSGYFNHKCRCDTCRDAMREYKNR